MYRVGFGYDCHKFTQGENIILGGVTIPHDKTIDANSDGDVLIHAICDAMLGACCKGDLGVHFNNSNTYKGISSVEILKKTIDIIGKDSFSILNIDATIVTEEPNLKDYYEKIKSSVSKILSVDENLLNIKSKTNDKLGFIGEKKGICVYACLMVDLK
tara:strand:+ start:3425 stop:3898 length:474 start_codon:yes stop_codon:yes gene_type:complete